MLEKCADVNAHFIADTLSGQGQNVPLSTENISTLGVKQTNAVIIF